MTQSETTSPEEDRDAKTLSERFPLLRKIGDRLNIPSGPLAGEPVVIRRKLSERGGVIFTVRYDDGRIKEWEWFE